MVLNKLSHSILIRLGFIILIPAEARSLGSNSRTRVRVFKY